MRKGDHLELERPSELILPVSLAKAAGEICRDRSTVYIRIDPSTQQPGLPNRFLSHPDRKTIERWVKTIGRDKDETDTLAWMAFHTQGEWRDIPKRTLTEHRAMYRRIQALCAQLTRLLSESGQMYLNGDGFGLARASVGELLNEGEKLARGRAIGHLLDSAKSESDKLTRVRDDMTCCNLTVEQILERVSQASHILEKRGTLHTQPGKRGAQRGFFVRRMGQLFQRRYGEQPHEVIAALTTIALGEATDRELVAKLLA